MEKSMKLDHITLGVCYYPEHWETSLWADDLRRMKEHGIEVIRIAEFAWNFFEPEEGKFTFAFFDEFLEETLRQDMKVIFCTPTATPPAWLTQRYPEVLNAAVDGTLYRHGMRCHFNYNSPVYRKFCSRIVEKLALHYGNHPQIIGWQIDNELNCECNVFYSEADHQAFREYLQRRFKTLENLNKSLGLVFWNQSYTSWDQVHLKRPTYHASPNPSIALEEKRFISESAVSYCQMQADILREHIGSRFITTNGIFGHLDSHRMTQQALDFITFDNYPNFAFDCSSNPRAEGNLNDRRWSWSLTRTRSISPNFGIMEQQAGGGGWCNRLEQPMPKPGQMRLWTMQAIAHGADFVSYFRWRTSPSGTEIYWHGLNDYSNEPNRRLAELLETYRDIGAFREQLPGAKYKASVALVKDYDNEWDGEEDRWHGPLSSFSDDGWFRAAQLSHTPLDFYYLQESSVLSDLTRYQLLVYPHAAILTKERAELLQAYVEQGGTLIFGARTGYKDAYSKCPMRPLAGYAGELAGVRVADFTMLGPYDGAQFMDWGDKRVETPKFNDILEPVSPDAVVEAVFCGNYYDGKPALVSRKVGKGTVYYLGSAFSEQTAQEFLERLSLSEPYAKLFDLPEECELAVREKDGTCYYFILNYKEYGVKLTVKQGMMDVLAGKPVEGGLEIGPYGVLVLRG